MPVASARTFQARPAVRERVPVLIGLVGASSSGKTKSALRIADGIAEVTGGEIYGIDTESRRMLHYAPEHRFQHIEFGPPFGSLDYLAAIQFCVGAGASVVIVDSMSHEHEGPGGLIDHQERELDRLAGNDYAKRERVKMLAWQKPKAARRALINGLLQLNANFIFCFRAREKTKPVKGRDGKTEILDMGFMPIAGEEFLFEMAANCLLLPKSNGVPTWSSEQIGERMLMKLPGYLKEAFPDGKPLSEDTGRALALWARGSGKTSPVPSPAERPAAAAATGHDPDRPRAAGERPSERGAVPSADDYLARWELLLEDATPETAAALATQWNAERSLRTNIAWPNDESYGRLRAAVVAKIEALKAAAPAAPAS